MSAEVTLLACSLIESLYPGTSTVVWQGPPQIAPVLRWLSWPGVAGTTYIRPWFLDVWCNDCNEPEMLQKKHRSPAVSQLRHRGLNVFSLKTLAWRWHGWTFEDLRMFCLENHKFPQLLAEVGQLNLSGVADPKPYVVIWTIWCGGFQFPFCCNRLALCEKSSKARYRVRLLRL